MASMVASEVWNGAALLFSQIVIVSLIAGEKKACRLIFFEHLITVGSLPPDFGRGCWDELMS